MVNALFPTEHAEERFERQGLRTVSRWIKKYDSVAKRNKMNVLKSQKKEYV